MTFLLFFTGLFFVAAFYNVVIGSYEEALGGLVIAGIMGGVYLFFRREKKQADEFLRWLFAHRADIERGGASYEGIRITPQTDIRQFRATLSFLFFTTSAPSRFLLSGRHSFIRTGLLYTLATLVFGWWGLPWGPIETVKSITRNLRGGHRITIGDILRG